MSSPVRSHAVKETEEDQQEDDDTMQEMNISLESAREENKSHDQHSTVSPA